MSRSKIIDTPRRFVRRARNFLGRYIQEKWRATVFVASCVTILNLGFNGLDAIESYAYLAVSNFSSSRPAPAPIDPIVVVRIDEPTFRSRYRERSPLDRCVLSSQLAAIYAAKPHLVVVDLDLSPLDDRDTGAEAERDIACQIDLERTLTGNTNIRTVVMRPFVSLDPEVNARATEWRHQLQSAGIRFGDAALPVSYGMTLKYFADDGTLNAEARRNTTEAPAAGGGVPSLHRRLRIDTHAYSERVLPILTSWTDETVRTDAAVPGTNEYTDRGLTAKLQKELPPPAEDGSPNRVVFFGLGHGGEDAFLTPIGLLYGVEVHAAAFASRASFDVSHVIAFLIDILFAGVFGMIIVFCWNGYFRWHCDGNPLHGELAWLWVGAMLVALFLAVVAAVVISFQLLSRAGLWLSPIPVAVGMLIESCMAGSVESAIHRLHHQPTVAPPIVSGDWRTTLATRFNSALWSLALVGALAITVLKVH